MINKESLQKAKIIDKETIKKNRKEQEEQKERSFARYYKICPRCSGKLTKTLKRRTFLDYISIVYHPTINLKCLNCGFELNYQEVYY